MGAMLSCLAAQAGFCLTSAACNVCCMSCGIGSSTATRIAYTVVFFLITCLAWLMETDWAKRELAKVPRLAQDFLHAHCISEGACKLEDMIGSMGVFRICWAMTMFFLGMSVIMIGVKNGSDWRRGLQNGWWALKVGAILGLTVTAFFIPNGFFFFWSIVGLIGAGLFILVQLLLLVDFAFSWSESWVQKWEESDGQGWYLALLGSTLGMIALSITMTVLMYTNFIGHGTCSLSVFFITTNLLFAFFVCVLAISGPVQEANERSGLLQAACVTMYSTYLVFTAVASVPDQECLPTGYHPGGDSPLQTLLTVLGAMITFVSVGYASLSVSRQSSTAALGIGDKEALLETGGDDPTVEDDESDGVHYNWSFFHLTFALASLYVMMLLTNWGTLTSDSGTPGSLEVGHAMPAVWVKVVTSWLTLALYAWVLVAPLVCTDRDFS